MLQHVKKSLGLVAVASLVATLGAGCSKSNNKQPQGGAQVGVTINALSATQITQMTLTVGPGTGTPSFANIVADLTNNDPTNRLSWSAYLQGIPAGNGRTFHVDAFDAGHNVIYAGNAVADIVAGGPPANVYMILQGVNDGGFGNTLPVVDSLTSSANLVTVGTTPPPAPVSLHFRAHDPDPSATMTYAWASTCPGTTFSSPTGPVAPNADNSVTWTPPTAVPSPTPVCTLSLTITDNRQGSVTSYIAIQIQAPTTGSASINAYANSWPMISGITAHEVYTKNGAGQVVAIDTDLTATVVDNDGDDVTYTWRSPNCSSAATGFTSALVPTATPVLAFGPGQNGSSAVHFHTDNIASACIIQLDVTDSWRNGSYPAGTPGYCSTTRTTACSTNANCPTGETCVAPPARGGDTVGHINLSPSQEFVVGPQITNVISPNGNNTVQNGQTVIVGVDTFDPTPAFNPVQTPFTFTWTQTGGTLAAIAGQPDNTASPGRSVRQWTASNPYTPGSSVTVVVTNAAGLTTSQTWNFSPANPCDGSPGSVGLACDTGQGLCAPNGHCNAQGACVSATPVTCSAADQCHTAGVCNPATGACSNPTVADGTACNADSNGCTFNDACLAGTCTAGAAPACNTPTDAQCQSAAGTCASTGNNSFTCSYANAANGTACNADTNGCTQNDSCVAGACTAGAAVSCTQSGNPCQAAAGACTSTGDNTHTCTFVNVADGTACNTAGACITGQSCSAGTCSGGTPFCPAGQSCNPVGPTCVATIVAPQVARDLLISPPAGLGMDTAGNTYLASAIFSLAPVSFDGHPVASTGDADLLLARYDTTGHAVWAVGFGDALANPQAGTGAAVTQDGTVAVIGSFSGSVTIGSTINSASQIDFLAAVSASTGSGLWARQFNDGANGVLKAVAANPNDATAHGNRIAVCGLASAAATDLVPGATYGGGNDIIIAVYSSTGTRLWSAQIGGAANEECDAISIDDNGDVYAAGKFDGATLALGGATSPLTGPGVATRKFLWVAKFNGATGAAISSAAYGGAAGQATPASVAVDASGRLVVAGQFTSSLPFGGTTLTSAGSSDAFVAKLDPAAAFAPVWAVRMGGTGVDGANSAGVTSFGDVIVTGLFNRTTTGVAALTANGTTASDAFLLKLNGGTGALDFAAPYGDAATQSGDALVVNRFGGNQIGLAGTLNSSITFPAPAGSITAAGATDVFFVVSQLQ